MSVLMIIVLMIACIYLGRRMANMQVDVPTVVINPMDGVRNYLRRGRTSGCRAYALIVMDDGRPTSSVRIEVVVADGNKTHEHYTIQGSNRSGPGTGQVAHEIQRIVQKDHEQLLNSILP